MNSNYNYFIRFTDSVFVDNGGADKPYCGSSAQTCKNIENSVLHRLPPYGVILIKATNAYWNRLCVPMSTCVTNPAPLHGGVKCSGKANEIRVCRKKN